VPRLGVLACAIGALGACGRFNFDPLRSSDGGAAGGDDDGAIDAAPTCVFGPFGAPTTDPTINSSATDWGPSLSADALTLIFASSRGGGVDRLFQTTRATTTSAWSVPMELTTIAPGMTTDDPSLSADQLQLFWGFPDVQLAGRAAVGSAWMTVGSAVPGTADHAVLGGPDISPDKLTLYFTGSRNSDSTHHMYEAHRAATTTLFSTSSEIPGLPSGAEYGSVRGDGLEVMFQRPGAGVDLDLFQATRATTADAFGTVDLLSALSSPADDGDIDISDDGTTVWFASLRQGGRGSWDLWTATRTCQ
jgi:hypothetical protein